MNSYCEVVTPLYFDNTETVDWLMDNDRELLEDVLIHNESITGICNGN